MIFQPADYCVCAFIIICAITGLFRGLSGTLAFFLAAAASSFSAFFLWRISPLYCDETWLRALGVLVLTLLIFGLVRCFVKRIVNKVLAQPSDSLFGFLLGLIIGFGALYVWVYTNFYLEYSSLATLLSTFIGNSN